MNRFPIFLSSMFLSSLRFIRVIRVICGFEILLSAFSLEGVLETADFTDNTDSGNRKEPREPQRLNAGKADVRQND